VCFGDTKPPHGVHARTSINKGHECFDGQLTGRPVRPTAIAAPSTYGDCMRFASTVDDKRDCSTVYLFVVFATVHEFHIVLYDVYHIL